MLVPFHRNSQAIHVNIGDPVDSLAKNY